MSDRLEKRSETKGNLEKFWIAYPAYQVRWGRCWANWTYGVFLVMIKNVFVPVERVFSVNKYL